MVGKHVFLSYSSKDGQFALKLAQDMRQRGILLWMDKLDGIRMGDDWVKALEIAVNEAVGLVAVLSPNYVQSQFCRAELSRANSLKHPIFPVLIQPVAPTDIPLMLQTTQYLDFTAWQTPHRYDEQLDLFMPIITDQLGLIPQAPIASQVLPDAQSIASARQLEARFDDVQSSISRTVDPPPPPTYRQMTVELTLTPEFGSMTRLHIRGVDGQIGESVVDVAALIGRSQHSLHPYKEAVKHGEALYQTIFLPGIATILHQSLTQCAQQSAVMRLLIKADPAQPYLNFPWDWLHDGHDFLIMRHPCLILRLMMMPNITIRPIRTAPKRVLFTSAVPQNYADFDLSEETIFSDYKYDYQPEKWLTAPRFLNRTRGESYDVWHHHGYIGADGWVLCDTQRQPTVLSIAEAGAILNLSGRIACAVWVLEGDHPYAPIALAQLGALGLMALVIVPIGISALVRTTFLNTFYDQLRYVPIEQAHKNAQKQAKTMCLNDAQWAMPLLVACTSQTGAINHD